MSLTAEDLQAISDLMDKKLEPVNKKLENIEADIVSMKEDIEIIKEDVEITREASNRMLEWFDTYQRTDKDKPFPTRETDIELKIRIDEDTLKSS